MKITVRITGILEAEMELPEATTSALGTRDWATWHQNQFMLAKEFIGRCADEARKITHAQRTPDGPGNSSTP